MLDAVPLTQDGGNSSRRKVLSSETSRMLRYLMSKVELTVSKRTSLFTQHMERSINNGTSFTLTNGRANQERESSMRSSDSMLRETSMLSLSCHNTDTLT
jgi:ssDNA-binding replication factor A large subunit